MAPQSNSTPPAVTWQAWMAIPVAFAGGSSVRRTPSPLSQLVSTMARHGPSVPRQRQSPATEVPSQLVSRTVKTLLDES